MKEVVYLLLQKQIEDLHKDEKIVSFAIQRIDQKKWLPLFFVKEGNEVIKCSLRLQVNKEVRTWADLRLLTKFLIELFGVERCELLLTDFKLPVDGDT